MGFSDSDSESAQGGEFTQDVWSGQSPYLQNMYQQFNSMFPWSSGGMQGLTPGAVEGMQDIADTSRPAWEQQLGGGAYQGMDLQGMYQDALGGGGAEQDINEMIMGGAGNDYVDAMKDQMQSDAFDNLGRQYGMIDQRASATGLPGSSRHGILQARAYEDTADALQRAQTGLGYETFDRDLDRKMDIARNADQFDLARLGSTQNALQQQQQAMQGGLNFGQGMQNLNMGQFAPYMMPWQAAGAYSNAMGPPVVLGSGNTFGSSDSGSTGVSFK